MTSSHAQRLIELLKLSEDEVLAALLSAFVPSNPGSVAAVWAKRKNYTAPPSGEAFWQIMVASDFRCEECKTHHDLTFHHRNGDPHDSRPENLQQLCRHCNRAKSGRPVKRRDFRTGIFKAYLDLYDLFGRPPTPIEIKHHLKITDLAGCIYMVHFLNTRFGIPTTLRKYERRTKTPSNARTQRR